MQQNEKAEIVTQLLMLLGFKNTQKGYKYLYTIITAAWKEKNSNWNTYGQYIAQEAIKNEKSDNLIVSRIHRNVIVVWKNGNNAVIKSMFGAAPNHSNIPSLILFLRVILSILFYCEDENVDLLKAIKQMQNPEYSQDTNMKNLMTGYIILSLKGLGLPETDIDRAAFIIDNSMKNDSFGEAFFTYIKYKSDFFTTVAIEDIVVPPEHHNLCVYDLPYDNKATGIKAANALCTSGILYLKDLRFKSAEDIKGVRNFGAKSYACFFTAIKKLLS